MRYLPLLLLSFLFTTTAAMPAQVAPGQAAADTSVTDKVQKVKPATAFAKVKNGKFVIGGQTFRFAGTNSYHLASYQKQNPQVVTRTLDAFEKAGIKVVRTWAFYDGYDCGYSAKDSTENVIQTAPGEYSEEALRNLDKVIAEGKKRGIRFILTFGNFWDDLGGICQYNTWDGAKNPSKNMHHFINDPDTQKWFKDYISMLTNRVNTVTGIAYKNEPAIFAWEIMNEAHYERANSPRPLRNWYQEIAKHIKSEDPNHMVATGEEGQETDMDSFNSPYSVNSYSNTYVLRSGNGTSYLMNTSIPEIDYGTAHWYPNGWGFGNNASEEVLKAQKAWISDHARIAREQGKPFVLGEYGFQGWGDERVLTVYKALWEHAEKEKIDGSMVWQYTPGNTKCFEYGGNICWPGGRGDKDLYKYYKEHIQTMNNMD